MTEDPASPSRLKDLKHGLQAIVEISQAVSLVADGLCAGDYDSRALGRFHRALSLLDNAMFRIARLGTDRDFSHQGKNAIEEATRIMKSLGDDVPAPKKGLSPREWLQIFEVPIHDN